MAKTPSKGTLATFTSLADFKAALAVPGAIVRVTSNEVRDSDRDATYRANAAAGRRVKTIHRIGIKYEDGNWLTYGWPGKWGFDGTEAHVLVGKPGKRVFFTIELPAAS